MLIQGGPGETRSSAFCEDEDDVAVNVCTECI